LSSQVLSAQASVGLDAWARLLQAHASTTRALSGSLLAEHGLTLNDYEALLRLARAEDGRMRRVDLAEQLTLTASGVTRLLDGLEAAGYVERGACLTDRRVVYAVITEVGREKLETASESHLTEVQALFDERFGPEELEQLAELLARLPGAENASGEDCGT
jgi:MarR family transcriptional regulator, 2-MHQ and catechol-resistance regulon repressor